MHRVTGRRVGGFTIIELMFALVAFVIPATLVQSPTNDHCGPTLPARTATGCTLRATANGDQANDRTKNGDDRATRSPSQNGANATAVRSI